MVKLVLLIGCLAVSIAIAGCGGGNDASTGESAGTSTTNASGARHPAPQKEARGSTPPPVAVPPGPPPKKMIVEELKKGHGAKIKAGDQFTANFVGINYKTGKPFETHWGKSPFEWRFGTNEMVKGLELGLKGMRVGGRRKLIVPSNLAYDRGALVYLIELLAVE